MGGGSTNLWWVDDCSECVNVKAAQVGDGKGSTLYVRVCNKHNHNDNDSASSAPATTVALSVKQLPVAIPGTHQEPVAQLVLVEPSRQPGMEKNRETHVSMLVLATQQPRVASVPNVRHPSLTLASICGRVRKLALVTLGVIRPVGVATATHTSTVSDSTTSPVLVSNLAFACGVSASASATALYQHTNAAASVSVGGVHVCVCVPVAARAYRTTKELTDTLMPAALSAVRTPIKASSRQSMLAV